MTTDHVLYRCNHCGQTVPGGRPAMTLHWAPRAQTPLTIWVTGTPAPQGSKRGFVVNGRAVLVESSAKVRPWRQDVKAAAVSAIEEGTLEVAGGPVRVDISFHLPRPRYHYGTGRNASTLKPNAPRYVSKKPDIDKLVRSTLDALGEAGVWRDDSQVCALYVTKIYTSGAPGALVHIHVHPDPDLHRSLLTPPEPTGLGAVVRDDDGDLWVRVPNRSGDLPWMRQYGTCKAYDRIDSPTVLHEGWTEGES